MSWIYQGKDFTNSMIPEGAVGFVYEMEAIIDGKSVRYVGKKNFYSTTKKKFGKRAVAQMTDKRNKKYETVSKASYQNYYSSNAVLKEAHKAGIPIKRYMVKICFSKMELTYFETKYQFLREVLEKDEYLNGNIGEVLIYDTALSNSDILQYYNDTKVRYEGPVTSNLRLYYDPSNTSSYSGTGTTINDLSGNGLNGTMSNITFTNPYFTYNGSSSQISVVDNALLEPGSGDWTIEFWVNHSVIAGASRVLIGKTDGGNAADWGYGIRTASNGNTYIEVGNGTTSITSPATALTINNWYQVVGVWTNVASNSIALYLNGNSVGSNSHSFTSIKNTTSSLYTGSFNGGQFSQWLNGRMGIVRMYNSALTGSQVLQNFNADKSKYGL